jgi:hypothetical protein
MKDADGVRRSQRTRGLNGDPSNVAMNRKFSTVPISQIVEMCGPFNAESPLCLVNESLLRC